MTDCDLGHISKLNSFLPKLFLFMVFITAIEAHYDRELQRKKHHGGGEQAEGLRGDRDEIYVWNSDSPS